MVPLILLKVSICGTIAACICPFGVLDMRSLCCLDVCSLDNEVALDSEHDVLLIVQELNSDIVGEGRGEGWHIEAELGNPVLAWDTSRDCAGAGVVLGGGTALPGLVEDDGAREAALEVDMGHVRVGNFPDATNVEELGGSLHDNAGVGKGLRGDEGEVLLSSGLSEDEVNRGCRRVSLVHLRAGAELGRSDSGENASECGLEHFRK